MKKKEHCRTKYTCPSPCTWFVSLSTMFFPHYTLIASHRYSSAYIIYKALRQTHTVGLRWNERHFSKHSIWYFGFLFKHLDRVWRNHRIFNRSPDYSFYHSLTVVFCTVWFSCWKKFGACNPWERKSYLEPFVTDVINCPYCVIPLPAAFTEPATSHAPQLNFPTQDSTTTHACITVIHRVSTAAPRISVQTIKQLISVCDWINYISCISVEKVFQSWVVLERLRYDILTSKFSFQFGFQYLTG